jgi:hypothetical protein
MKYIVIILLVSLSSISHAAQHRAILSWDEDNGKVLYSWKARLQLGDPAYTSVKAVHLGKRETLVVHPTHNDIQNLNASPMWNQEATPPEYNLRVGTWEYCSILVPTSEFTGSGLDPLTINETPNCYNICYDLGGGQ